MERDSQVSSSERVLGPQIFFVLPQLPSITTSTQLNEMNHHSPLFTEFLISYYMYEYASIKLSKNKKTKEWRSLRQEILGWAQITSSFERLLAEFICWRRAYKQWQLLFFFCFTTTNHLSPSKTLIDQIFEGLNRQIGVSHKVKSGLP